MEISLIIPTFNRPKTLRSVIDSYLENKNICELIVIDDCSSLSYEEFNTYISKLEINYKYIKNQSNKGAAYCRNLGVSLCSYSYLLWGEDDAFVDSSYIKELILNSDDNVVVFGAIYYDILLNVPISEQSDTILEQQNKNIALFDYSTLEGYYRLTNVPATKVPFGHALFLINKDLYKGIDYYEGYKVNGYREETDVQIQFLKKNVSIMYIPTAICYHLKRSEIEENSGQHSNSRFKYELYKIINNYKFLSRHSKFLRNYLCLKQNRFTFMFNFIKSHYLIKIYKKLKGMR